VVSGHSHGQRDHDTIQVHNQATFRTLQIRLRASAVHFNRFIVRYIHSCATKINLLSELREA